MGSTHMTEAERLKQQEVQRLQQQRLEDDQKRLSTNIRDLDRDGDVDLADDLTRDLDRDGRIDGDDRKIHDLDHDNDIDAADRELKIKQGEQESVGAALGLSKTDGKWQEQSQTQQVSGPKLH